MPHLPLPSVKDTCQRYLWSVQPLINQEDFYHTKDIVENFAASDQVRILQQELVRLDKVDGR